MEEEKEEEEEEEEENTLNEPEIQLVQPSWSRARSFWTNKLHSEWNSKF